MAYEECGLDGVLDGAISSIHDSTSLEAQCLGRRAYRDVVVRHFLINEAVMLKPETAEDPSFIFLNIPRDKLVALKKRPLLLHTLQNFETALLLLAIDRSPPALSNIVSAIESAGRAHQPEGKLDLAQLIPIMNSSLPREKVLPFTELRELREKRNKITHYGFSPNDNEESIRLFFRTALPFLESWMEHQDGISIVDGLGLDLGPKVRLAMDLIRSTPKAQISAVDAIRGVVHWILHHTRLSYLTWWEQEVLRADASTAGMGRMVWGIDLKNERKEKFLEDAPPNIVIDCPICGMFDSLVVKVDDDALENKRLVPSAARCVECSFNLPTAASGLLMKLCADKLTDELCAKTFKDYGYGLK